MGCLLSVLAGLFLLVGLIPLFGWLNWITTLPLAVLAVIFSNQRLRQEPGDLLARLGLVAGVLVFAVGAFRLALGGGIL